MKSIYQKTKGFSSSIVLVFLFIIDTVIIAFKNPSKLTIQLSKVTEQISEIKIPKILRKPIFQVYSKRYNVKLQEITQPLESFYTFSSFFTRKIKQREINLDQKTLICPADSKVLKISEINKDQCCIIKQSSYSFCQLIEGRQARYSRYSRQQIQKLKKSKQNKLYQVIFYLAPGDYHRFHSPTLFQVQQIKQIQGVLYSVNEATLIKRKKVYEKNARVSIKGTWKQGFMNLVMVGALNVGRIHINRQQKYLKAQQIGYFNLGSTIVMIIQGKNIEWNIKQGQKVRYGDLLFNLPQQKN